MIGTLATQDLYRLSRCALNAQDLELPPLEDANAIVLGLTKGLQAMIKGQMNLKSAGMYFYGSDCGQRDVTGKVWRGQGAVKVTSKAYFSAKARNRGVPR